MKNEDQWKKFEKTGDILDYLKYTACACEETMLIERKDASKNEEGGHCVEANKSNRDGFIGHGYW